MRNSLAGALLATAALVTTTACGAVQQPPPAPPSAQGSQTPRADWVRFSWPEAGFAAELPAEPVKSVTARTLRGVTITFHLAIIQNAASSVELGVSTFSVGVPAKDVGADLRTSIEAFATLTGSAVSKIRVTRFHGFPARTAVLSTNASMFRFVIFQRDPTHSIFIYAPTGLISQKITTSLRLL